MIGGSDAPSSGKLGRDASRAGQHALSTALPNWLAFNQAYDPQFAALGSANLESLLFGGPARQHNVQFYDSKGNPNRVLSYNLPEQRGLLDIIEAAAPRLGNITSAARAQSTADNIGLMEQNLGRAQEFYRASDPDLMALREALTRSATTSLNAGSRLLPEDAARITRGVRGDWATRGLGMAAPAQLEEAVQLAVAGETMRGNRLQSAGQALGMLSATQPDYARFILGLGDDSALANAFNLTAGNQGMAFAQDYSPLSPASASMSSQANNLQYQEALRRDQAWGNTIGGALDAAASMYSFGLT